MRQTTTLEHLTSDYSAQPHSRNTHENRAGKNLLALTWARTESEVREAQRLRYQVFTEMGAHLEGRPGLDEDEFDAHCEHLLVRDADTLDVIGTYRLLPPHGARRAGRLYAEQEFDLCRLAHLRPKMVEVGRACVRTDYRNGAVIMSLWAGLAAYMMRHGYETMLGCASVPMSDGGHYAADLSRSLSPGAFAASEYHALAHTPLPVDDLHTGAQVSPPPLLKGYLRLGAKICGGPAWDADFNTADFLTHLRIAELDPRYARHFLSPAR